MAKASDLDSDHLRDGERAQVFALHGTASRGEDLRAGPLRKLNGSEPHAARGGMDQDPIARSNATQVVHRVVGGEKRDRDSRRFLIAHSRRLSRHEVHRRDHVAAEAMRGHCDDSVSDAQIFNAGSDGGDRAGALHAYFGDRPVRGLIGTEPERGEHVEEVQARRRYPDGDFVGARLAPCGFAQHDAVEHSGPRHFELKRTVAWRKALCWVDSRGVGFRTMHVARRPAKRDFTLFIFDAKLVNQRLGVARRVFVADVDHRRAQLGVLVAQDTRQSP